MSPFFLCACAVVLRVSVVKFAERNFTTEAQGSTELHRDPEIRLRPNSRVGLTFLHSSS